MHSDCGSALFLHLLLHPVMLLATFPKPWRTGYPGTFCTVPSQQNKESSVDFGRSRCLYSCPAVAAGHQRRLLGGLNTAAGLVQRAAQPAAPSRDPSPGDGRTSPVPPSISEMRLGWVRRRRAPVGIIRGCGHTAGIVLKGLSHLGKRCQKCPHCMPKCLLLAHL